MPRTTLYLLLALAAGLTVLLLLPSGTAVPLTDTETLVATPQVNETAPLLAGDWLVWRTGQDGVVPTYHLWARDLTGGPDRLLDDNATGDTVSLNGKWVVWGHFSAAGGPELRVHDLTTDNTTAPQVSLPEQFMVSAGRLYYFVDDPTYDLRELVLPAGIDRVVYSSHDYIEAWTVAYPRLAWVNNTNDNSTLWLRDLTNENAPTQVLVDQLIESPTLGSDRVVWYNGTLVRMAHLDGTNVRTIWSPAALGFEEYNVENVNIDGDFVAWTLVDYDAEDEDGMLYRISTDETKRLLLLPVAQASQQRHLVVDDERFVWADDAEGDYDLLLRRLANVRPTASIDVVNPNPVAPGGNVTLAGSGSDSDGTIVAYEWRLNDTAVGSADTVTVPVELPAGEYPVVLRVRDDDGAWSDWEQVMLRVAPPASDLTDSQEWFTFAKPNATVTVKDRYYLEVRATDIGKDGLSEASIYAVRVWVDSPHMERRLLLDTKDNRLGELRDRPLFELKEYDYSAGSFYLTGVWFTAEMPNDRYTLQVEALDEEGWVLHHVDRYVLVEHPRSEQLPTVSAAVAGAAAGGTLGMLGGAVGGGAGGAAGAGGGALSGGAGGAAGAERAADLHGLGSSTRRRKRLRGGKLVGLISFVLAIAGLMVAYGYASMVNAGDDPQSNLDQFQSTVVSDYSTFATDLMAMMLVVTGIVGLIVAFRAGLDHYAARAQGIRSVYRLQLSGLAALGLTTALFGTPFGYPAQSLHESAPGSQKREARIAKARIFGLLGLALPFWAAWYYLPEMRFITDIGLALLLMSALAIAVPLGRTEGRSIWRTSRLTALMLLAVTAGLFYGWQLLLLPELAMPVVGAVALLAMVGALRPLPRDDALGDDAMGRDRPGQTKCEFCLEPMPADAPRCPTCGSVPLHPPPEAAPPALRRPVESLTPGKCQFCGESMDPRLRTCPACGSAVAVGLPPSPDPAPPVGALDTGDAPGDAALDDLLAEREEPDMLAPEDDSGIPDVLDEPTGTPELPGEFEPAADDEEPDGIPEIFDAPDASLSDASPPALPGEPGPAANDESWPLMDEIRREAETAQREQRNGKLSIGDFKRQFQSQRAEGEPAGDEPADDFALPPSPTDSAADAEPEGGAAEYDEAVDDEAPPPPPISDDLDAALNGLEALGEEKAEAVELDLKAALRDLASLRSDMDHD